MALSLSNSLSRWLDARKMQCKERGPPWRFMRQICRTCRHNIVWPVCIDGCRHTATGQAGTVQLHVRRCHAQGALVSAAVDTIVELKVHPLLPVPVARLVPATSMLVLDIYPFQYCLVCIVCADPWRTALLNPFPSYTPEEPGNRLFILKYF